MAAHLARRDCEECCISSAVDGADADMLWNGVKRMGILEASVCGG